MENIDTTLESSSFTTPNPATTVVGSGVPSTTDLLSYQFPDSTEIIGDRYGKFVNLISTFSDFASGYENIALASVKQYEILNDHVTTHMPVFESTQGNSGLNEVSGSQKVNIPESTPPPSSPTTQATEISTPEGPADLNVFLALMRKTMGEDYTRTLDFKTKVEAEILPDLKQLAQQVEKTRKEFISTASSAGKDLAKLREASAKACQQLDLSVQEYERGIQMKSRNEYKKDPYLVKRNLLRDAVLQVKAENNRIEFLANCETGLRSTEARIILELKRIFSLLAQYISLIYGANNQSFLQLNNTLNNVSDDVEWNNFLQKNGAFLVTSEPGGDGVNTELTKTLSNMSLNSQGKPHIVADNPYKRDLANVTFRNSTHPSTKPLLEGVLQRKESTLGLNKSYHSYYFVISPAGYFYGFPSRSIDSTQPNLVLYIPDCQTKNMGNDASGGFKFSLRGKDASGLALKKSTYTFKASSAEDYNVWWNAISTHASPAHSAGTIISDDSDAE